MNDSDEYTPAETFDMQAIAEEVNRLGHPATVGRSGSSIYTIYVGATESDGTDTQRYAVLAGPGTVLDDGKIVGYAGGDFCFGIDDDGATEPYYPEAGDTAAVIAARIARLADLVVARRAERGKLLDRLPELVEQGLNALWKIVAEGFGDVPGFEPDVMYWASTPSLVDVAGHCSERWLRHTYDMTVRLDDEPDDEPVVTTVRNVTEQGAARSVQRTLSLVHDGVTVTESFHLLVQTLLRAHLKDGTTIETGPVDLVIYTHPTPHAARGHRVEGRAVAYEGCTVRFDDGYTLRSEDIIALHI